MRKIRPPETDYRILKRLFVWQKSKAVPGFVRVSGEKFSRPFESAVSAELRAATFGEEHSFLRVRKKST